MLDPVEFVYRYLQDITKSRQDLVVTRRSDDDAGDIILIKLDTPRQKRRRVNHTSSSPTGCITAYILLVKDHRLTPHTPLECLKEDEGARLWNATAGKRYIPLVAMWTGDFVHFGRVIYDELFDDDMIYDYDTDDPHFPQGSPRASPYRIRPININEIL